MPLVTTLPDLTSSTLGSTPPFIAGTTTISYSDYGLPGNLPALTTQFSYFCTDRWLQLYGPPPWSVFVYQGPSYALPYAVSRTDNEYQSCQPQGAVKPRFSPGVCPSGYTVAKVKENLYCPQPRETTTTWWDAVCCPSELNFYSDIRQTQYLSSFFFFTICAGSITQPLLARVPSVQMTSPQTRVGYVWSSSSTRSLSPGLDGVDYVTWTVESTFSSGMRLVEPVSVVWQKSDWSAFPSAYALSVANQVKFSLDITTPASASATTTPSEPGNSSDQARAVTLNVGSKTGIVMGTILGVALIIGAIIFILRRRRGKGHEAASEDQIPEMEDQDQELRKRKWFLGGRWRSEAEVVQRLHELDSRAVRVVPGPPAELEAGNYRVENRSEHGQ